MESLPDLREIGYEIQQLLSPSLGQPRRTYLAIALARSQPVVLKQVQFALPGLSWGDYRGYEQEMAVLQSLDHPAIPRYLGTFETDSGVWLVQEYKDAPSLGQRLLRGERFAPERVWAIARQLLEILVYLQNQSPPIIHRDLKPENVLLDESGRVYLVDFGFARGVGSELSASSTVQGTLGFMPPEQMFGQGVSEASDLYGLGAMLICLLTGTTSRAIAQLMEPATYRIRCRDRLPQLPPRLVNWLERLVAPNPQERYGNAALALEALALALESASVIPRAGRNWVLGLGLVCGLGGLGAVILARPMEVGGGPNRPKLPVVEQMRQQRGCVGCDLRGANLSGADLQGYDLRSADLRGANLEDADLRDVDLRGASLVEARLLGARWVGAKLGSADLRGAVMPEGELHP